MKVVLVTGFAVLTAALWSVACLASEPRTSFLEPNPTEIPAAISCLIVL